MFPRAQEVLLTCRHPRLDHAKQNLVIYGGFFNDQETSLVTGFDRLSISEKKLINKV